MPDTLDLATLTAAAAEAAGQGDAAAAAALLRLALDQQVGALGPDHRALAPTLNNLAMMLERQGETAEAERCYRRAYAVARQGAPADDPQVVVSRANLVAFLQASGIGEADVDAPPAAARSADPQPPPAPELPLHAPVESPVRPPTPTPPVAPPRREPPRVEKAASSKMPPASTPAPTRAPSPAPTPGRGRGRKFAVAIGGGALVGAMVGWLLLGPRPTNTVADTPADVATVTGEPTPAAPTPAASISQGSSTPPPAPAGRPTSPPAPAESPTAAPAAPASKPAVPPSISVDGRLCTTLARSGSVWRCEAAANPTTADALYYYSRVRSSRDVVVRHRWSHDGEVVRTVPLEVRANPGDGFRTFSRQTLAGRSGNWEVALLAPDGTVVETLRVTRN